MHEGAGRTKILDGLPDGGGGRSQNCFVTLMDTSLWEDLLLAVEEGQVVPIVGRDLLVIKTETGPRMFHELLAERLAAELNVRIENMPADSGPNEIICSYAGFHGDPIAINPKVVRLLKNLRVPAPEPLRLLAEIEPFRLFVATTYDTLLEEALGRARECPPAVVAFPPASHLTDFDDSLLERHGSLV